MISFEKRVRKSKLDVRRVLRLIGGFFCCERDNVALLVKCNQMLIDAMLLNPGLSDEQKVIIMEAFLVVSRAKYQHRFKLPLHLQVSQIDLVSPYGEGLEDHFSERLKKAEYYQKHLLSHGPKNAQSAAQSVHDLNTPIRSQKVL